MKAFVLALLAAGTAPVFAQSISLNSLLAYQQNFDNVLPSTSSNTLFSATTQNAIGGLAGWQVGKVSGTGTTLPYNVDNGNSNTGSIFSYGATSSTERALGSVASGTTIPAFGAWFTNNTGSALAGFTLSFTSELWRSSTLTNNVLAFGYALSGGAATSSNFLTASVTAYAGLNAVGPSGITIGANSLQDGNLAANQQFVSASITGLSWGNGQDLFIRWQDTNDTGNDAGLAIDNLTFTAIPEPSTYALLLGAATSASVWFLRRRQIRLVGDSIA